MCSMPSSMLPSKSIGFGAPMVLMSTALMNATSCRANYPLDKNGERVKRLILEFKSGVKKVISDPQCVLDESDVHGIAFFFQAPYADHTIKFKRMLKSKWKTCKDPADFLENLYGTVHGSRKHGGAYNHRFLKFSEWCKNQFDRQSWETRIKGVLHPALKSSDNPALKMINDLLQYADEKMLSQLHRTFHVTDDDSIELGIIKDLHTKMNEAFEQFETELYPNERIQAQNLAKAFAGIAIPLRKKLPIEQLVLGKDDIPIAVCLPREWHNYWTVKEAEDGLAQVNESIREIVKFSATDLINYEDLFRDLKNHADDPDRRREILFNADRKMKKLRERVAAMAVVFDNTSTVSS